MNGIGYRHRTDGIGESELHHWLRLDWSIQMSAMCAATTYKAETSLAQNFSIIERIVPQTPMT